MTWNWIGNYGDASAGSRGITLSTAIKIIPYLAILDKTVIKNATHQVTSNIKSVFARLVAGSMRTIE
jgi:hypothetical protein